MGVFFRFAAYLALGFLAAFMPALVDTYTPIDMDPKADIGAGMAIFLGIVVSGGYCAWFAENAAGWRRQLLIVFPAVFLPVGWLPLWNVHPEGLFGLLAIGFLCAWLVGRGTD